MATRTFWSEPKGMVLGPGNASSDLHEKPDPPDVIRFSNHYGTIDTEDPLYEAKLKWIDGVRSSYGVREISEAEAEAVNDPTAISCPASETCDWRGPAAARDMHILAHRPPDGESYEPPRSVTYGTGY